MNIHPIDFLTRLDPSHQWYLHAFNPRARKTRTLATAGSDDVARVSRWLREQRPPIDVRFSVNHDP